MLTNMRLGNAGTIAVLVTPPSVTPPTVALYDGKNRIELGWSALCELDELLGEFIPQHLEPMTQSEFLEGIIDNLKSLSAGDKAAVIRSLSE